jgi:hypothetical protein
LGYRNKQGKPFTDSAIGLVLDNPTYAGVPAWNRKKKRLGGEPPELVAGL